MLRWDWPHPCLLLLQDQGHQVIPAEAVEAAHRAWREQDAKEGSIFEYNLRAALEAAAPYMQAALADSRDGDLFRFTWAQREWLRRGRNGNH